MQAILSTAKALVFLLLLVAGTQVQGQINIQTNFDPATGQPIDTRFWLENLSDTTGVTWEYEGLTAWAKDVDEHWFFDGTYWRKLATQGADGTNGTDGAAATVSIGATSTGTAGSSAVVTNSGTTSAAIFDFTIPRGAAGNDGANGSDGADGDGWTSGSYNASTGAVTFSSVDGLGFVTGDLRGADGANGSDGNGISSASYNSGTGVLTFTYDDASTFSTSDIRGATGAQGIQGVKGDTGDTGPQGDPATDDQTLSIAGQDLTITGGNTITLPSEDTTRIGNTSDASVKVYPDSIVTYLDGLLYSRIISRRSGSRGYQELFGLGHNSMESGNTNTIFLDGGTNGTTTRTFGPSSPNGKAGNFISGTAHLMRIQGGYDNSLHDVLASTLYSTYHSAIERTSTNEPDGHAQIIGGSYKHLINPAYFSSVGGTRGIYTDVRYGGSLGSAFDTLSGEFQLSMGNNAVNLGAGDHVTMFASKDSRFIDDPIFATLFSGFNVELDGDYAIGSGKNIRAYGTGLRVGGSDIDIGSPSTRSAFADVYGQNINLGLSTVSSYSKIYGLNIDAEGESLFLSGEDLSVTGNGHVVIGYGATVTGNTNLVLARGVTAAGSYSYSLMRNANYDCDYCGVISGVNLTHTRDRTALADNLEVRGGMFDGNGDDGSVGEVLTSTGTATNWASAGSLPVTNPYGGSGTIQATIDSLEANQGVSIGGGTAQTISKSGRTVTLSDGGGSFEDEGVAGSGTLTDDRLAKFNASGEIENSTISETSTITTIENDEVILGGDRYAEVFVEGMLTGGLGAAITTGVLDFDDASNLRAGTGYTLLRGSTAANSPNNSTATWHTLGFQYGTKGASTSSITQLAVPALNETSLRQGMYIRDDGGAWYQMPAFDISALDDGEVARYNSSCFCWQAVAPVDFQDGNGILEGGTPDVLLDTDVQGFSYDGSASFDTRQQWGHNVNGEYVNGWYTAGASGIGLKHEATFTSAGALVGDPYYQAYGSNFEYTRLLPRGLSHNSNGRYFMLDFYGSKPRTFYDTGTDDWYQSGQDARPTEDAVQVTKPDGTSTWNPYTRQYRAAISTDTSVASTTYIEPAELRITGIEAGIYSVKVVPLWEEEVTPAAGTDWQMAFNVTNLDATRSGYQVRGTIVDALNDWTADNPQLNDTPYDETQISHEEGIAIFTDTGTFNLKIKIESTGQTVLLKKGMHVVLTKMD